MCIERIERCVTGARDLQDVLQYLIVHLLRDTTHRRVDCFDHQHPVYESELLLKRTVLENQRQYVLTVQHLRPTAQRNSALLRDEVHTYVWLLVYSALDERFGESTSSIFCVTESFIIVGNASVERSTFAMVVAGGASPI